MASPAASGAPPVLGLAALPRRPRARARARAARALPVLADGGGGGPALPRPGAHEVRTVIGPGIEVWTAASEMEHRIVEGHFATDWRASKTLDRTSVTVPMGGTLAALAREAELNPEEIAAAGLNPRLAADPRRRLLAGETIHLPPGCHLPEEIVHEIEEGDTIVVPSGSNLYRLSRSLGTSTSAFAEANKDLLLARSPRGADYVLAGETLRVPPEAMPALRAQAKATHAVQGGTLGIHLGGSAPNAALAGGLLVCVAAAGVALGVKSGHVVVPSLRMPRLVGEEDAAKDGPLRLAPLLAFVASARVATGSALAAAAAVARAKMVAARDAIQAQHQQSSDGTASDTAATHTRPPSPAHTGDSKDAAGAKALSQPSMQEEEDDAMDDATTPAPFASADHLTPAPSPADAAESSNDAKKGASDTGSNGAAPMSADLNGTGVHSDVLSPLGDAWGRIKGLGRHAEENIAKPMAESYWAEEAPVPAKDQSKDESSNGTAGATKSDGAPAVATEGAEAAVNMFEAAEMEYDSQSKETAGEEKKASAAGEHHAFGGAADATSEEAGRDASNGVEAGASEDDDDEDDHDADGGGPPSHGDGRESSRVDASVHVDGPHTGGANGTDLAVVPPHEREHALARVAAAVTTMVASEKPSMTVIHATPGESVVSIAANPKLPRWAEERARAFEGTTDTLLSNTTQSAVATPEAESPTHISFVAGETPTSVASVTAADAKTSGVLVAIDEERLTFTMTVLRKDYEFLRDWWPKSVVRVVTRPVVAPVLAILTGAYAITSLIVDAFFRHSKFKQRWEAGSLLK